MQQDHKFIESMFELNNSSAHSAGKSGSQVVIFTPQLNINLPRGLF